MFASLLPVSAFAEEAPAAQKLILDCPFAAEGAERVAHVHNEDCFDAWLHPHKESYEIFAEDRFIEKAKIYEAEKA